MLFVALLSSFRPIVATVAGAILIAGHNLLDGIHAADFGSMGWIWNLLHEPWVAVLVPAGGHTPGSIVGFITVPSMKRYALIGDLVWQREGVDLPAERPWLARSRVDKDEERVRDVIVRLHQLQKTVPHLTIVPAHDRRVWDTLPRLQPPASSPGH